MQLPVGSQHCDGNFEDDRVHVESRQGIGRVVVLVVGIDRGRQHAASGGLAEIQRIEIGAQVDEEGIGNRAREYPDSVRQRVDALLPERGVIRHGARADVGRNGVEGLAVVELLVVGLGHHVDGIGLYLVQALANRGRSRR